MSVYVPTKDDIIAGLEAQLRLKEEHIALLNGQIADAERGIAERDRLLRLQAERREVERNGGPL